MTIESEQDLRGLKAIGQIVGRTIRHMRAHVRPGITTGELDAIGGEMLKKYGARSAPMITYHFPGATCISLNDEAAHGIPGPRRIQPGDLVNIDVSAELDGYFADAGLTVLVPPASPLKQKLLHCAYAAFNKAVSAAVAGQRLNVIGEAIENQARRCGLFANRDLSGHGIGRRLHEAPHAVPSCHVSQPLPRLNEGMVLALEAFLSAGARHVATGADGWVLKTVDGSPSVQFEHTLVVTGEKPIIVTAF